MRSIRKLSLLMVLVLLLAFVPAEVLAVSDSSFEYYVTVDQTNQIVTCYRTSDDAIVRQMLCSAGLNGATVCGTFKMPKGENEYDRKDWYYFTGFKVWAKYPTRIYKGILFHSLTYNKKNETSMSKSAIEAYGKADSHGCVRLLVEDAKWIQEHCPIGTTVTIYRSGIRDEALRKLLFQEGYTIDSGLTYNEWWGLPNEEGAVGRYSSKDDIKTLQSRLIQLGYYTGDLNGVFDEATTTALLRAQLDAGVSISAYVDGAFASILYSEDAPTAISSDLKLCDHGPLVRSLQKSLTALGMYSGPIDGIYDQEVADSVSIFQSIYGYTVDGNATRLQQEAMVYEGKQVAEKCGDDVTTELTSESIAAATVQMDDGLKIRIRKKADEKSDALGSLASGTQVLLLETGNEWSKIQSGSIVGYMKNKYLEPSEYRVYQMKYSGSKGTYSIGCSLAQLEKGAEQPKAAFEGIYESIVAERKTLLKTAQEEKEQQEQQQLMNAGAPSDTETDTNTSAWVNTGSDDVRLNLREEPNTAASILTELSDKTEVTILLTNDGWAYVDYDGTQGYVLLDYLTTTDPSSEDARSALDGSPTTCMVTTTNGFSYVYESADKKSEKIGYIRTGTEIAAYGDTNGFTFVRYGDSYENSGYVKSAEISASNSAAFATTDPAAEETGKKTKTVIYAYVIDSVETANLYNDASSSASVVGTLPTGTRVTVVSAPEDSEWALIKYKGHQAYMKNADLRFDLIKA